MSSTTAGVIHPQTQDGFSPSHQREMRLEHSPSTVFSQSNSFVTSENGWIAKLNFALGAVVPLYMLDESVALKSIVTPMLLVLVLAALVTSSYSAEARASEVRGAASIFVVTFIVSTVGHVLIAGTAAPVNVLYPFIFVLFALRAPRGASSFSAGLFFGLVGMVVFGWYRFVLVEGGDMAEHALGYWGIKYTEATRNNDALAPSMLAALTLAAIRYRYAQTAFIGRAILWAAMAVSVPAIIMSYSRSAWIAVVCFCLLLLSSRNGSLRRGAVAIGIASVAVWLVLSVLSQSAHEAGDVDQLVQRYYSIFDVNVSSSNSERTRLLTYGFLVGIDNPWMGIGPGNFPNFAEHYGYPELAGSFHPENLLLHFFSEYGLFPALTMLVMFVSAILIARRNQAPLMRFCFAALASLSLWLQFNSEISSLMMWVILGVIFSVVLNHPDRKTIEAGGRRVSSNTNPTLLTNTNPYTRENVRMS